jgi:hypothetical protein
LRPTRSASLVALVSVVLLLVLALPAAADHTDPRIPLAPTDGAPATGLATGAGIWEHLRNFGPTPASDVKFFTKDASVYASHGTLGQGPEAHVGQRIIKLTDDASAVDPQWWADHGSAACQVRSTGVLGLQHDNITTPPSDPELLVDTTDSTGRCHDAPGGGLELIDISGIGDQSFEPREIHSLRFDGLSHTTTRFDRHPWLIFSNNSDFGSNNVLDFADVRSCLSEAAGGTLPADATLEEKREECRPVVYRIPFQPEWTQATRTEDGSPSGASASCHDTTIDGNRLYCSGLNAELILDIGSIVDGDGNVRGTPLPCSVVPGTDTGALVTNCAIGSSWDRSTQVAEGWEYVTHFNHPGRADQLGGTTTNSNTLVPSNRGVAVSHESRPTPDKVGSFLIVSDERGGGVVPGGASCTDNQLELGNVYGNGGLHFFTMGPDGLEYAEMVDDDGSVRRAVWQGDVVVPSPTFCVVHRFRHLPDEQRIVMGYYSQGTKVLDYRVDGDGRLHFTEVASFVLPGAVTWTGDVFKTVDNPDGTRTYHFMSSDIARGADVFSWTHTPNPIQKNRCTKVAGNPNASDNARKGCGLETTGEDDPIDLPTVPLGDPLLTASLGLLPLAAFAGRRRRKAQP